MEKIKGLLKSWISKLPATENRKDRSVFMLCLLMASISWALVNLGESVQSNINFTLNYSGLPENQVLLKTPPKRFEATIEAVGWDISSDFIRRKQIELEIDLKNYITGDRVSENALRELLRKELGADYRITSVEPSGFPLDIVPKAKKEVPVRLDANLTYKAPYNLYKPIQLRPSVVEVSGAKSILDTISSVETKRVVVQDIDGPKDIATGLKPIDGVEFTASNIECHIPAEEFTGGAVEVPIQIVECPDGVDLTLLTSTVTVNYTVPISYFEQVDASEFKLVVNCEQIDLDNSKMAKIMVASYPEYCSNLRQSPAMVEFIAYKNN